ncbi:MAG TPA: alpha/beta hydrolase [Burkholderiaceae bacterium]|jgi:pimeloyl-ACP methyl ester carboxylesterase|nr:alpha/beta hydrolase [Burkholderiaceae bacterium]
MTSPNLRYVTCAHPGGLHRLAYWEWGDADNPQVLLCVHGLTRTGRDFDAIAQRLSRRFRVVCPDMIGRGRSDWVEDPMLYVVPQYVADCVTLVARLGVDEVDWLGTSMGGLIGLGLASLNGHPIRRLILNDIGPEIDPVGLARIASYAGAHPYFDSFEQGEERLRQISAEFGPHTPEQFRILSSHYVVQRDGRWTFHFDPSIGTPFKALFHAKMPSAWPQYDAIRCPTLVIRGERSDVLSRATAEQMTQRGPRATLVELPGVGHAPTFIPDDQIEVVERYLARGS